MCTPCDFYSMISGSLDEHIQNTYNQTITCETLVNLFNTYLNMNST